MLFVGKLQQSCLAFPSYSWCLCMLVCSTCSPVFHSVFNKKLHETTKSYDNIEVLGIWIYLSPNKSAPAYPKSVCWQIIWRLLLKQKLCNSLLGLPCCLGIHSWIAIPELGAVSTQRYMESQEKARRTEQAVSCGLRTMETRSHNPWCVFPFDKNTFPIKKEIPSLSNWHYR